MRGLSSDNQEQQQQQGQLRGDPANGSTGSRVALSQQAAAAVPWLKGALWTMTMYFAGERGARTAAAGLGFRVM